MMYKYVRHSLFFIIPFLLDRFTKHLVITGWLKSQVINDYFNIYVTFNRGIAWSIGSGMHDMHMMLLNIFIGFVLIYFAYYLRSMLDHWYLAIGCTLILSGGVSNFIDRIWYGHVIDFIQLHIGQWYFPVFNVADVSISLGAALLLYGILFTKE